MSPSIRPVSAVQLFDFEPELVDFNEPSLSAAWDGSVLAVARRSTESPVIDSGHGIFAKSKLDEGTEYGVCRWLHGAVERVTIPHERLLFHFVQPMPDGVLAVAGRSRHLSDGPELNAVVFDRNGRELRRFLLGDGINDVRTTRDGRIWVSYFDEGVFGNHGWGGGSGPEPVGAPGLRAFSADGEPLFAYDPARAGTDAICDAYALNVDGDGSAWVYFHTAFPIVHIRDGQYRAWTLGASGAHALAVDRGRALLLGEYKDPNSVRVVRLSSGPDAEIVERLALVDESGATLRGARGSAVGSDLFLFQGTRVSVVRSW